MGAYDKNSNELKDVILIKKDVYPFSNNTLEAMLPIYSGCVYKSFIIEDMQSLKPLSSVSKYEM